MMSNNIERLAQTLIEQNEKTKAPFLDLGDCGLNDYSPEWDMLTYMNHLTGINLGQYYYSNSKPVFTTNKLAHNFLTNIPRQLPKSIKQLYINLTSLTSIEGINEYPHLEFFDAFGNNIETLPQLQVNENLKSLGLSKNYITRIDNLEAFPKLELLYLGQNKLSEINPVTFKNLKSIKTAYLYKNEIKDLSFLKDNTSLRELYLSDNIIEECSLLKDLLYLEKLDLTGNKIDESTLSREIILAKSAVKIRLQLHANPKLTFAELLIQENLVKKEEFLDLGNCGLTDRAMELQKLETCTHLKSLNLGVTYYTNDNNFESSQNHLSYNIFTQIPKNLPSSLLNLQMRDCGLTAIRNIDHLSQLDLLDLSENEIREITGVENLKSLTELALFRNKIMNLNEVVFPSELKVLYLDNNRLSSIEPIVACQKLRELYLSNNTLFKIKPLSQLPNLEFLELSGNPIDDCPSDVWISNNIGQIRAYFKDMETVQEAPVSEFNSEATSEEAIKQAKEDKPIQTKSEEQIPNDVKLIILGNSKTGKTHLVHFLEHGTFLKDRNSTNGLEVKRWKPNPKRFPQLENTEVSIWDFGGQEYYHDAYKLFLGTDALFIALWCTDSDIDDRRKEIIKDNQTEVWVDHFKKDYWLDTIQFFRKNSVNSPLIVVQNKVDNIALDKKRLSQELHEEYNIKESFHISFMHGCIPENKDHYDSMKNFADYVANTLAEMAQKAQLPVDCKRVRNEILKLSDAKTENDSIFKSYLDEQLKCIKLTDFTAACKNLGTVNSENLPIYPSWLNNGGTLVYFENNTSLNDTIFTDPKLLSSKIYDVLNERVLMNNGELEKSTLDSENEIILDAMKSLELLYPHPCPKKKDTHYIAPQYLPEDHPIEDLFKIASVNAWEDSFWIRIPMFYYKKLMHYLLLHYISDQEVEASYFWKNGIILLKNEKKVLIKGLFPTHKEGIIQVSIENHKDVLSMQRDIFNTMLAFTIKSDSSGNDEANRTRTSKSSAIEDPTLQESQFIKKLELSVDGTVFESYSTLRKLDSKRPEDANKLLKYQYLLPFADNSKRPKNIFVSYSHKNAIWVGKIRNHLAGLRRSNFIKDWTDQEIRAGEDWNAKIKQQMEKADVFILLLSADFIASDFIWNEELKAAFDPKNHPDTMVIPILVEPCDITATPEIYGKKIQSSEIIPKDGSQNLKPLSLWENEAEGLTRVAERIREVVVS